jgi:NAD(P)-dependent dehydrogenase (short-subunit alcohol dehydrogenase family)
MRVLHEQIATPGNFLVTATRLGGLHGYGAEGATAPLGGAVTGFAKAFKRERNEVLVKAVDFALGRKASEIADLLIEETLGDPGAMEIGHSGERRFTVGLREEPASDGQPGLTLDRESVFVVTGAAGSIVAAITADLATASGGTFYLLDLAPAPDPESQDLRRFTSDREGLKRDLFERAKARGERATPAMVERELAGIERAHCALEAIEAVRAAGGEARYHSVDLRDGAAVARAIDDVRAHSGRIDVLMHAAGVEVSHFLPSKDPREFDLVFDVKSDGWFNLLRAAGDLPIRSTVVFSSIAGRFGNAGQTDYSAANDLLCKTTASFRTTRPETRGIAIDWTAWSGIGMASRGSIPQMMELAGIDMLPADAGIPVVRRELTAGGFRGEVVIAGRLGVLQKESDETGGLDLDRVAPGNGGPMIGHMTGLSLSEGLVVETTLDPAKQAFLDDHRIDGTPVLPGVMGIEAFGELATQLVPGYHIRVVEDVNFLAPFKFYRGEPRCLTLSARIRPQGANFVADCRLIGERRLANQSEPQRTTHFTARVLLEREPWAPASGPPVEAPDGVPHRAPVIYRLYFHGPAYQVLDSVWTEGLGTIGLLNSALPPDHDPNEAPLVMAPRLIELCFQTAGLREMVDSGRFALPQHIDQVSVTRDPAGANGPLYAVVLPGTDPGSFDAEVTDAQGNVYVRMVGYRTVALPGVLDSEQLALLGSNGA